VNTHTHTHTHTYTRARARARTIHIPVFLKRRFLGDSAHVQGINGRYTYVHRDERISIRCETCTVRNRLRDNDSLSLLRFDSDRWMDRPHADWGLFARIRSSTERMLDERDGRSINKRIMQQWEHLFTLNPLPSPFISFLLPLKLVDRLD